MQRRTLFALFLLGGFASGADAASVLVQGIFKYEDRIWGPNGYTGTVQNLPIRNADVEIVRTAGDVVLGTTSTHQDGSWETDVELSGVTSVYVRCLASTDNEVNYHIKVVNTFTRSGGTVDLTGSAVHAIATPSQNVDPAIEATGNFGTVVIQDLTGSGVAQAFNILDNAVDAFDYLNSTSGIGRFPSASEFVVYGWNGTTGSSGSNYFWQGIFIASVVGDTDGWSDTVILHETGHWANDMFTEDNNPGGAHFIGDNVQDPRLSYGEGYATFFCAEVREQRSTRLNGVGVPIDDHVSYYADLGVPPAPPTAGALEFAYDFETGLFQTGVPIGQIGTANETNVTSAMWDLVDGTATRDETLGADDEPGDETGSFSWDVLENYMIGLTASGNPITIEDYYEGWYAVHGSGFMQTEAESAFIGLASMMFFEDAAEPDDDMGSAPLEIPLTYAAGSGAVVINEIDQGVEDKIELFNASGSAVNMAGWKVHTYRNGFSVRTYTFGAFTLYPGAHVVVHEGGSATMNGSSHVFGGGGLSIQWANGDDGACTLVNGASAAVDFVRWDNVSGSDPNTTPTPPGTGWTGTLFSSPGGKNLCRDQDGSDADLSSDFDEKAASMGAPNFDVPGFRTIYPSGDVDVVQLDVTPGDLVVVRAQSSHSAGDPRVEILDASGAVLSSTFRTHGFAGLAEVQALIDTSGVCYARFTNASLYTDWAPLDVLFYKRPFEAILAPPPGIAGDPDNVVDVADRVSLSWLNGGAYDSVEVLRNGGILATLAGGATSYEDHADRGLHTYSVRGKIGASASAEAKTIVWAGTIDCWNADGLEAGASGWDLDSPWALTSTLASEGSWSLHDSPAGMYGNNVNLFAEVLPPTAIQAGDTLRFDHICITEATFDFGIVEASTDFGNTWSELARYDMDDHPEWNDGTASAGDWFGEAIDLSGFDGEFVRFRFRLSTDPFVVEDGWYVDNVAVSDSTCEAILGAPTPGPKVPVLLAGPNPFHSSLDLTLAMEGRTSARVQVFDTSGRLVRTLHDGAAGGELRLRWDGRDEQGRDAASGVYLIRAATPEDKVVARVVRIP